MHMRSVSRILLGYFPMTAAWEGTECSLGQTTTLAVDLQELLRAICDSSASILSTGMLFISLTASLSAIFSVAEFKPIKTVLMEGVLTRTTYPAIGEAQKKWEQDLYVLCCCCCCWNHQNV